MDISYKVLQDYYKSENDYENTDLIKMKLSEKYEISFGLLNAEPQAGNLQGGWDFSEIKKSTRIPIHLIFSISSRLIRKFLCTWGSRCNFPSDSLL